MNTTKLTKRAFIENCQHPELAKKVLNQIGDSFSEICEHPYDYRDASNGVSGFIYYSETVPFAKKHLSLILEALNEFEQEYGLLEKPTDKQGYYNWLAWFALESTIQDLIYQLEAE